MKYISLNYKLGLEVIRKIITVCIINISCLTRLMQGKDYNCVMQSFENSKSKLYKKYSTVGSDQYSPFLSDVV